MELPASLRPIYMAGRIIGFVDAATGERLNVQIPIGEAPMVHYNRSGQLVVTGGSPRGNERLLDALKERYPDAFRDSSQPTERSGSSLDATSAAAEDVQAAESKRESQPQAARQAEAISPTLTKREREILRHLRRQRRLQMRERSRKSWETYAQRNPDADLPNVRKRIAPRTEETHNA
jgi:hypothetical protein